MADLTKILGGPWSPPPEKRVAPPEDQLRDAMLDMGLTPPDEIYFDGKIHRFRSGTKGSPGHGDKPGWYLVFGDGVPAGRFGCWRAGVEVTWKADIGRKLSEAEEQFFVRRIDEAKVLRDAEIARKQKATAETVEKIWLSGAAAHPDHPYLKSKGVQTHGVRTTGDGRLMVPLYDQAGNLSTLQYIDEDGGKMYHPGGKSGGCFWMVGTMDEPGVLYVAEGFATAATIYEMTDRPCVVAYSASNLVPVTGSLREMYGAAQDIVVVADNDESGTGQRYAEQACEKHGVRMVMPPIEGMDVNDFVQAGHDLPSLLNPPSNDWLIHADDFSAQPAPISWIVKRWLQRDALMMVHGPSGGGKTFVVLDMCLRVASGGGDWNGQRVTGGTVVYLAGEGHYGLRGRIAAWKHHHSVDKLNLWVSKSGCDLNTGMGYGRAAEQIRSLPEKPSLIVVDTLHRFLAGDENSAQDAKTMLDACAMLMREFGCSVLLVHHTGVSDEAQHRARGSSAWRGALDIEISVVPSKNGGPIEVVQRKSKDAEIAEPVYLELESVAIPGWVDEDGEQVTSAVVVPQDPPAKPQKDSPIVGHRKTFESAWWSSGAEERNGKPYISRSAMIDYLTSKMGISEASAKVYIRPSATGRLISELLVAEIIEAYEHGWIAIDDTQASAMLVRKSER